MSKYLDFDCVSVLPKNAETNTIVALNGIYLYGFDGSSWQEVMKSSNLEWKKRVNFAFLRRERDILLVASDWTQVEDAPVDKAAWAEYRQALRDLPENTVDPRDPIWPTRPDEGGE